MQFTLLALSALVSAAPTPKEHEHTATEKFAFAGAAAGTVAALAAARYNPALFTQVTEKVVPAVLKSAAARTAVGVTAVGAAGAAAGGLTGALGGSIKDNSDSRKAQLNGQDDVLVIEQL